MPAALAIVDSVARAAALLRQADDADARAVAEALDLWRVGVGLDEALGLANGWRALVRDRARGEALERLAALLPAGSDRATAGEAAAMIARYAASTWLADRRAGRRPPGLKGAAFDVLQVSEPPSAETIRRVLRHRNGSPRGVPLTHAADEVRGHEQAPA